MTEVPLGPEKEKDWTPRTPPPSHSEGTSCSYLHIIGTGPLEVEVIPTRLGA